MKRTWKISLIALSSIVITSAASGVFANIVATAADNSYHSFTVSDQQTFDTRSNLILEGSKTSKDYNLKHKDPETVKTPEKEEIKTIPSDVHQEDIIKVQPKPQEPPKKEEIKKPEEPNPPQLTNEPISKPGTSEKVTETPPPTIEQPKVVEPPKVIETPKPIEKKPEIIPPQQVIQPVQPVEKPQQPKTVTKTVQTDVGNIQVTVEDVPPRVDKRSDQEKGITNRIPYRAELVPDLKDVKLNAENYAQTVSNGEASLKAFSNLWAGVPGKPGPLQEYYKDLYISRGHDELQNYLNNSPNDLNLILQLYDKYRNVIEAGNAKKFMYDSVQNKYDEWFSRTDTLEYIPPVRGYGKEYLKVGWLWIAMNMDPSKFKELSQNLKNELAKGFYISKDERNVYVNDKGELDSYAVSPIFNSVVAEMKRNNAEKRALGYDTQWTRSPDDIARGNYPGWRKYDGDMSYKYRKYGFESGDGISVTEYNKESSNTANPNGPKKAFIMTADLANEKAFAKITNVIKNMVAANDIPLGIRILNIGKYDDAQNIRSLLSVLPKHLPLLELYFDSFNTSALEAISDKNIDELGLYTSLNSLDERWSINPWALRNVAWVNTLDYNVSSDYNRYEKITTRITFNSLAFDEDDWHGENDMTTINNGLRMAYVTRNNERIFQGAMGPGLKPDRNASGNSYPTGLDLSRIKEAKGLKNMIFYDEDHGYSTLRKLTRIVLYNNSDTWETDTDNMNKAQFAMVLAKDIPMPRSKIIFSNVKGTKNILIKPKIPGATLDGTGLANLSTLIAYSDGTFFKETTKIFVPNNATNLYNQLKANGYNVDYQLNDIQEI
ncbi:putative immunoglobulin-blocking virulence protein [Mycoplasma sp. 4423]